ncbi:MAG: hypothetical protein L6437_09185 [Kiritimatiellae bacterium]|nr:hypothetical protein [Kiritimatiellia bacterium]
MKTKTQTKTKGNEKQKPKTPKPGTPCPNCGRTLNDGGITGGAWCKGCGSVFGAQYPKPDPRGPKDDAFLRNIESWLAKPHTAADIEQLLKPDNIAYLYKTFGYAPLAWKSGTDILRAGLKRPQAERDQNRPVQRKGDQLVYAQSGADAKRARNAKRYGKLGTRPIKDKEKIGPAIARVFELLRTKQAKTQERACNIAIKEFQLHIKWQGLARHFRKSPQWKNLKKRIAMERKQPM